MDWRNFGLCPSDQHSVRIVERQEETVRPNDRFRGFINRSIAAIVQKTLSERHVESCFPHLPGKIQGNLLCCPIEIVDRGTKAIPTLSHESGGPLIG